MKVRRGTNMLVEGGVANNPLTITTHTRTPTQHDATSACLAAHACVWRVARMTEHEHSRARASAEQPTHNHDACAHAGTT